MVGNESEEEDEDDEDLTPEEKEKKRAALEYRRKMEAEGFTTVTMDDVNKHRKRGKDSYGTVVEGVTQEEMDKLVEKQRMRQ